MVPEVRADCTPESEGMHVTCGPPSRTRACTTAVLYCDTTAYSRKLFLRRPIELVRQRCQLAETRRLLTPRDQEPPIHQPPDPRNAARPTAPATSAPIPRVRSKYCHFSPPEQDHEPATASIARRSLAGPRRGQASSSSQEQAGCQSRPLSAGCQVVGPAGDDVLPHVSGDGDHHLAASAGRLGVAAVQCRGPLEGAPGRLRASPGAGARCERTAGERAGLEMRVERRSLVAPLLGLVVFASASVVLADGRVALVVGNSTYTHIGRLPKPGERRVRHGRPP